MNGPGLQVEFIDRIAFPEGEPQISRPVEVKSTRTIERRIAESRAVSSWLTLTGSGERRDDSGFHIHFADTVIFDIGDIEITSFVKADAVRLVKSRLNCLAAITRKASASTSSD